MENYINTIPFKQLIIFLVIGVLLYFISRLVNLHLMPVLKKNNKSYFLYAQRMQIAIWVVYFLLFFSYLLLSNILLIGFISFVFIIFGWSFLHNLYSGILIKFRNSPKSNDYIRTDFIEGKIKSINWTDTEIIVNKGELVVVPNQKLYKSVIKHLNKTNTLNPFVYSYNISNKTTYKKLLSQALNCPYFTANQEITINKNQDQSYQVNAMLIDESFKEKAISYFNKLK